MRTLAWLIAALVLSVPSTADSHAADHPNIIVFYTDDHGHADLSCQRVVDDIRTPNVDALAAGGVRAIHGYSTAPQCVPSRAGLLTGRFQARFGLETNGESLDGFNRQTTLAQRLQRAGYVTAQFGKWHLGPTAEIPKHGFKHVFAQKSQASFTANITLGGEDRPMGNLRPETYHVDGCSQAAAALIARYRDQPLFLYIAYRAPHVPLDAPAKYLKRFPGKMPERRRQALAMLSAVDDGVGLVMQALRAHNLSDRTLVFYIGDNGAPLKIHKADIPGGGPGWDGSLNDPLNGEKGMLTEGGMHTPFVVSWPGTIPGDQQYPHPISALDVAATAVSIAGIDVPPDELDGVNLIPFLSGMVEGAPHDALLWRWAAQSAIREGKWKLLRAGDREYLFDLDADLGEKHNLTSKHPDVADRLRKRLTAWSNELTPPGLQKGQSGGAWGDYYDFYLDGKTPAPLRDKFQTKPAAQTFSNIHHDWLVRNGKLTGTADGLEITTEKGTKNHAPFLTRNRLNLAGPVSARLVLKTTGKGPVTITWRTSEEKTFAANNRISVDVGEGAQWQTIEAILPGNAAVIHVRVQVPSGATSIKGIELKPSRGKSATLLD